MDLKSTKKDKAEMLDLTCNIEWDKWESLPQDYFYEFDENLVKENNGIFVCTRSVCTRSVWSWPSSDPVDCVHEQKVTSFQWRWSEMVTKVAYEITIYTNDSAESYDLGIEYSSIIEQLLLDISMVSPILEALSNGNINFGFTQLEKYFFARVELRRLLDADASLYTDLRNRGYFGAYRKGVEDVSLG